jgi:hypothetical protein
MLAAPASGFGRKPWRVKKKKSLYDARRKNEAVTL